MGTDYDYAADSCGAVDSKAFFPKQGLCAEGLLFYEKVQLNLTGDKREIEALMKKFMKVHQVV